MKNFTYYQPASVQQALPLLGAKWGPAELLAGGTDLLDLQKEYIAQPERVVSLSAVKELRAIEVQNDLVRVGSGVTLAELAGHAELRKRFPALTTAAGEVGGPQIRNMGTLGGNLCQRNRCWYFRDEHVRCLLKGGSKCYAVGPEAQNRYHAIFTQGHKCVIVHPSTLAPGLIALSATAVVVGPKGQRVIPLEKFFQAPQGPGMREHVLSPDEIVRHVDIPLKDVKNASYEVRQKVAHDWPLAQAAVAYEDDGGTARNVRVVLGHVAPTPLLSAEAAKALEGKKVTEESAAAAGRAAASGAKPLGQNAYKTRLLEVAVRRAVLTAAGLKRYWEE
ncbi:MAG TPA: xanthine dehydrogenase family protein subunit M [Gemmataceae bacterium]